MIGIYLTSILEIVIASVLIYAAINIYKKGDRYQITGIGLGIMSFAFIIKSIFNYFGVYISSSWGLVEFIDLMGAIIIVWSIIKK